MGLESRPCLAHWESISSWHPLISAFLTRICLLRYHPLVIPGKMATGSWEARVMVSVSCISTLAVAGWTQSFLLSWPPCWHLAKSSSSPGSVTYLTCSLFDPWLGQFRKLPSLEILPVERHRIRKDARKTFSLHLRLNPGTETHYNNKNKNQANLGNLSSRVAILCGLTRQKTLRQLSELMENMNEVKKTT